MTMVFPRTEKGIAPVFRTWIAKGSKALIAMSWEGVPLQMGIEQILSAKGFLPATQQARMNELLKRFPRYRIVVVMDWSRKNGGAGVVYVPTLFPQGFSVGDLKW